MLLKRILKIGGLAPKMEFEDKNLKAVLKKASKVLKVPEEALKYEVISYGSTGIFGLVGAKKAKIRVFTSAKEQEPKKVKNIKDEAPKKVKEEKKKTDNKAAPKENEVKKQEEAPTKTQNTYSTTEKDAIELGRSVIQKIIDKITDDAKVHVEKKDESVMFNVEGGKTALVIGKRGQTLEAIQYLVDRVVNRNSEQRIRLQVDVGGYLENKKANLEQRAMHLAEKVKKTGKPITVGELNVYDRKIVHICLKEEPAVRTQSMGSGFYRKLVIFPKKSNNFKKHKNS
jgi:spoIIIJ-associated protein